MSDQNPGCLGALLRLFGMDGPVERTTAEADFPYRVRDDFLSPAELSFYRVLLPLVEGRAIVCPKVGLSDVFFVARPHENQTARNRIAQKHVDFLLCAPQSLKPLAGIELDDSSHSRPDRQARDEFVGRAFAAASLPLLRVPVGQGYNPQALAAQLEALLAAKATVAPASTPSAGVPLCPKCGVPMVARKTTRGERAGQEFWGCPHYPQCRETAPMTP